MRQKTYEILSRDADANDGAQRAYVEECRRVIDELLGLLPPPGDDHHWARIHWRSAASGRRELLQAGRLGATGRRQEADEAVDELYFRGLLFNLLRMDFAEFRLRAFGAKALWPGERAWPYWRRGGFGDGGCPFRDGRSYRRDVQHLPKDQAETPARCWRLAAGHRRDKARAGGGHWQSGSAAKSFHKRLAARRHRRWARNRLRADEFEIFHGREYVEFADPWAWD